MGRFVLCSKAKLAVMRMLLAKLRSWVAALAQVVLPRRCLACSTPWEHSLCSACTLNWQVQVRPVRVRQRGLAGVSIWAGAPYAGSVRQALLAHKAGYDTRRARVLAQVLAAAVGSALEQACQQAAVLTCPSVVLVPAPSRRQARRSRRADPVALLAAHAAALCRRQGLPVRAVRTRSWLVYTRAVADQSGLSRVQRQANLHRALLVARRPGWWPYTSSTAQPWVIIVDDIVTTGATAAELSRALAAAAIPTTALAVVAATA